MLSDQDLIASVRTHLAGAGTIREVKMFGGIGFMLNGNMVAAASKRGLMLRVRKERYREALTRPGVKDALAGGGGLRADVVRAGTLRVGDEIKEVPE